VDVVTPDPALLELLAALRRQRERLGLSLSEVSRRSGIDTGDLSRLENGKIHDPRSSTLSRYASALGKRLSWSLVD
jgi:transcriptional regulator with XRE-family HTH domain